MGISHVTYPVIERTMNLVLRERPEFTMIELGNQHLRNNFIPGHKAQTAKEWFERKGINHYSIDINGKDGAVKKDLSKPVKLNFTASIVTNFGTSEHIRDQYQVFKNIHNFTAFNGYIIHTVPEVRSWIKHCLWWYTERFFIELSKKCGYNIISIERLKRAERKWLVAVVFKKIINDEFMGEDSFRRILTLFCEEK